MIKNETTDLLFQALCLLFLFRQPQQEVVADHLAQHCVIFAPRIADYVTSLSVVGGNWDHKYQEWPFLLTFVGFIQ